MNRDKCINCKHYDTFFGTCDLYYEEIYLSDGEYELRPVSIRSISKSECKYKVKEN